MDLYEHYLESLDDKDMKSEGEFVFFCNTGMQFYYHMMRSSVCAQDMLLGKQIVTYSDFSKLQILTQIFADAKKRCDSMLEETDLPYVAAKSYIECMIEECSILKKIHLSKPIMVDELCNHVDAMSKVDPDSFNKIFMPDYPEDIRDGLMSFESKSSDRMDLLYACVVTSAKMGF